MDFYIISTGRLGLRRWVESDIEPFIAMNKDESVMKYFPRTLSDDETIKMVEKINLHFEKNRFGLFAVENKATKKFIGFTGFSAPGFESFFTPCVEIGWRYEKNSWGQGFATEAATACLNYGFHILKFDKVVSFTSLVNVKSQSIMKRIGMKYVAEFDHPLVEPESILCRHVLYQVKKEDYLYCGNKL